MKDSREFKNYKDTLARREVLMLATVGSTVLGLEQNEKSDIDEMGVCLETPAQLIGFAPFEHEVYRTAHDRTGKVNAKSEAGDIDLTLYGLRKFVRLALGGNPNLITLLYLPKEKFSVYTEIAAELQALAPAFASKQIGKAFLGYLQAQRLRLLGEAGQMRVHREDLVGQYGYDTKYAMHMLRLAIQGYDYVARGALRFPLATSEIKLLRQTRNGELYIDDVMSQTSKYEAELINLSQYSSLPDKPDYDKVEQWMLSVYERAWHEDKTTSQQQGLTANQARQNTRTSRKNGEEIEDSMPF